MDRRGVEIHVPAIRALGMKNIIISLYDYSGIWPLWFSTDDFEIVQVDIKHGIDIRKWQPSRALRHGTYGVLAAPPCTDMSVSGSQYWAEKDADGRTALSVELVMRALDIVDQVRPKFWVLENPVGRLWNWIGPPNRIDGRLTIHPHEYAGYAPDPQEDRYTKATCLWGHFRLPPKKPLAPIMYQTADGKRGSWMWAKLGGKSARTKELRSQTPMGIAAATWIGNRSW